MRVDQPEPALITNFPSEKACFGALQPGYYRKRPWTSNASRAFRIKWLYIARPNWETSRITVIASS